MRFPERLTDQKDHDSLEPAQSNEASVNETEDNAVRRRRAIFLIFASVALIFINSGGKVYH